MRAIRVDRLKLLASLQTVLRPLINSQLICYVRYDRKHFDLLQHVGERTAACAPDTRATLATQAAAPGAVELRSIRM